MGLGSVGFEGGEFRIAAAPHVAMRLKRIFPRSKQHRSGEVAVAVTAETARDLEWVLERWKLDLTEAAAREMEQGAARHRESEEVVAAALAGALPFDPGDPARPPRDYQIPPAQLVDAKGGLLLTDELGLGKSMASLMMLRHADALPALVVTLTHLPSQWVREIAETWPDLRVHVLKKGRPYSLERVCRGQPPDVIVSNYHKLAGWSDVLAGQMRTVIFDEAQELRRFKSQKYEAAAYIAAASTRAMGLTATPVYNYGDEIYNVLSVLAPEALGSWPEFAREWCGGTRHVTDSKALGGYLRAEGLMLRRTRAEVGRELPGGHPIRVPHVVDSDADTFDEMTGDAVELAMRILGGGREAWSAGGQLDFRLRQATGLAKAPHVATFVKMLLESGEPLVLWGWHRAVYDIWAEELADHRPAFYTGSESPKKKDDEARRFLEGGTDLLIMSLRAGAGLDGLQERCSVGVFGELDWSPGIHDQCLGRLARDGQEEQVVGYYLVAEDGSDPVVADVLNLKRQESEPLIDPGAVVAKSIDPEHIRKLARRFLERRGMT